MKDDEDKKSDTDDESGENTPKKKDTSKSTWKRDKLLTEKLSSTDSEAEFEKFSKKKQKLKEKEEASR